MNHELTMNVVLTLVYIVIVPNLPRSCQVVSSNSLR